MPGFFLGFSAESRSYRDSNERFKRAKSVCAPAIKKAGLRSGRRSTLFRLLFFRGSARKRCGRSSALSRDLVELLPAGCAPALAVLANPVEQSAFETNVVTESLGL